MSTGAVYSIARYGDIDDPATLQEQVQLLSLDGVLRLRGADGTETDCAGTDIEAVISSTPSLREICYGQQTQIICDLKLAARLPFVLEPVPKGEDAGECYAKVNGQTWAAYPTIEEDYVMLPGHPDDEPTMNPCWAEFSVSEGEWNPLQGWTSIGLATPGVAVECQLQSRRKRH